MIDATLEPVEALKQRIAELEAEVRETSARYTQCRVEASKQHDRAEIIAARLDIARKRLEASKLYTEFTLAQLAEPDADHCPSCGEYLHDEMGHMCPDTGVQQDPYVRLRAALVENDHLKRQLAEARRKAFEEAAEIAEKMTPLSGMGVQTGRHIAKALREAGK